LLIVLHLAKMTFCNHSHAP